MPAHEVEREVVGVDAAEFRRKVIGIVDDLLMNDSVQRIFKQRTEVSPLLSNPILRQMGRIDYVALARVLVPVEPMPPGVSIIFDKDIRDAGA